MASILSTSSTRRHMNLTLPSPISDAVALLQADTAGSDDQLLDVLASIVHPDMVCSLFALRSLEPEARSLAIRCIDHALTVGLTSEQSAVLYSLIEPRISARF